MCLIARLLQSVNSGTILRGINRRWKMYSNFMWGMPRVPEHISHCVRYMVNGWWLAGCGLLDLQTLSIGSLWGTLEERLILCKNPHLLQIWIDRIQREPANIVRQTLSCVKKYFQKAWGLLRCRRSALRILLIELSEKPQFYLSVYEYFLVTNLMRGVSH